LISTKERAAKLASTKKVKAARKRMQRMRRGEKAAVKTEIYTSAEEKVVEAEESVAEWTSTIECR
jgi:hypothetical protein